MAQDQRGHELHSKRRTKAEIQSIYAIVSVSLIFLFGLMLLWVLVLLVLLMMLMVECIVTARVLFVVPCLFKQHHAAVFVWISLRKSVLNIFCGVSSSFLESFRITFFMTEYMPFLTQCSLFYLFLETIATGPRVDFTKAGTTENNTFEQNSGSLSDISVFVCCIVHPPLGPKHLQ